MLLQTSSAVQPHDMLSSLAFDLLMRIAARNRHDSGHGDTVETAQACEGQSWTGQDCAKDIDKVLWSWQAQWISERCQYDQVQT